MTKAEQIVVSGNLIENEYEREDGGKLGDIYLFPRADAKGRFAMKGNHANYGYSGYFLASIYDGKKWRRFAFNKLIDYPIRHYDKQEDKDKVIQNIRTIVSSWANFVASLDPESKYFRILDKEI